MKKSFLPYIGSGIFILAAAAIVLFRPFSADLDGTAQIMLGAILVTLGLWIFKPFGLPYAAGGMFLGFAALASGLKPAAAFSGFTSSAIWTLVPALFFGFTLQKTGLGKRIALGIIRLFRPSYPTLVLAWVIIGVVLSILTPSITVRVAIVMPIAVQCCDLCKIEKGSKGGSLILLTALSMALIPGSGWMTGALWGPIISGMINAVPGTEGLVTFNSWFGVLFLPTMIITVLLVGGGLLLLRPGTKLSSDAAESIRSQSGQKVTRNELFAGVILLAVFAMLVTGRFHGIPDAALCLAAVVAFFLFGVLEPKDFNTGVNWDLIVFVAMALSLGTLMTDTGISKWLAGIVVPALEPIAGSPWAFALIAMAFMFVWRFLDVAFFIPTMSILVPILPSIQERYGISPLVWLALFVMAANSFLMAYQNVWAMMGRTIAGERAWENKHLATYGALYIIACFVALLIAIPVWTGMGYFG